ncbi:GumC family protein [Bradyrhizobium sp. Leo170]|uniref:GumC family protein n=1 Tax=Bradyrhizobium sp. Leo170 TaxID=1571199 RepID=UPI001FE198A1|nr:GumC family protein [Bradyrhizobium sp. Leo170]
MLTLSGTLSFLRENGRRIVMLALAIFAIGVIALLLIPVRYAATALVVVDPREQRVTTDQDVLPGIGQDAAALQSLVEIAKSDGFLRPLIEQLKVRDDEDIAGGQTDTTRLLERFRNRLDISRRGLTYVIGFKFTSNRPDRAAYYANAIAEAFVANQGRVRTEATDEAADWLSSRLKTLNDRLRASEDAVAAFKLEHRIVNAGKDATTQQLRVTDLTQQVSAARARTEEAKARYEQAQRDLKANVDGPVRQDLLSALRAQRSALNDQIAQKRAVFGDRHPDLVISYSQLNDLNRQIEIERKKNIETAKSEYEAQREQQRSLEDQLKAVESQILVDGQALVRLQELQRDAEANRNIYEQFLSRFKTTNEQRLLQSSQTKIASLAIPPLRPTRPPLTLLLAALAIASILISTAVVAVPDIKNILEKPTPKVRRANSPSLQPELPQLSLPPPARIAAEAAGLGPHSRSSGTRIHQKRLAKADCGSRRARSECLPALADRENRRVAGVWWQGSPRDVDRERRGRQHCCAIAQSFGPEQGDAQRSDRAAIGSACSKARRGRPAGAGHHQDRPSLCQCTLECQHANRRAPCRRHSQGVRSDRRRCVIPCCATRREDAGGPCRSDRRGRP